MGELLTFVVTHEVGHTLGLPHNFKASSLYPVEKLRDPEWLKTMGHTPTIMDYCRFNYVVVQPEDKVPPELLIPRIGPYDKLSILWGYKPIPAATKPDDEKAALGEWLKVQETTPWLRFSTANSNGSDPGENTEATGDSDAIQATTLGTKNIKRVMDMLLTAVPKKDENYDELGAVFATPEWAVRTEVIRRVEPTGGLSRVLTLQRSVLTTLLNAARLTTAGDLITSLHLREMRDRIAKILDPKVSRPAAATVAAPRVTSEDDDCWPDLAKDYLPQGTRKWFLSQKCNEG
jgi:hypothetical protein